MDYRELGLYLCGMPVIDGNFPHNVVQQMRR